MKNKLYIGECLGSDILILKYFVMSIDSRREYVNSKQRRMTSLIPFCRYSGSTAINQVNRRMCFRLTVSRGSMDPAEHTHTNTDE